MDISKLPEARLIVSNLDGTPLYFVFKTEKGWVGAPGLRKGQVLTDDDVKDGIPYIPAPVPQAERIAMDIRFRQVARVISTDPTTWVSESGRTAYGDDEVIELTDHERIEVGRSSWWEVADFFGVRGYSVQVENGRHILRRGHFDGEVVLEEGARVWRTDNTFYVLQPDAQYFQTIPRVPRVRNS